MFTSVTVNKILNKSNQLSFVYLFTCLYRKLCLSNQSLLLYWWAPLPRMYKPALINKGMGTESSYVQWNISVLYCYNGTTYCWLTSNELWDSTVQYMPKHPACPYVHILILLQQNKKVIVLIHQGEKHTMVIKKKKTTSVLKGNKDTWRVC